MLGAGALGRPRRMLGGERREEGSEWGIHVYQWWVHFDIWQNYYNIVKFKNKIKLKNKKQNNTIYANYKQICKIYTRVADHPKIIQTNLVSY